MVGARAELGQGSRVELVLPAGVRAAGPRAVAAADGDRAAGPRMRGALIQPRPAASRSSRSARFCSCTQRIVVIPACSAAVARAADR